MSELQELLEVIREEQRLAREEAREEQRRVREEQLRSHEDAREEQRRARAEELRNQARFERTRDSMRQITLEIRENTLITRDMREGIQAQTRGLLHVLDRLEGRPGPGDGGAGTAGS